MLAELMRLKYASPSRDARQEQRRLRWWPRCWRRAAWTDGSWWAGRVGALRLECTAGTSPVSVAEADESERSFLKLSPILAVVTNL